jgi:hypothetical protein
MDTRMLLLVLTIVFFVLGMGAWGAVWWLMRRYFAIMAWNVRVQRRVDSIQSRKFERLHALHDHLEVDREQLRRAASHIRLLAAVQGVPDPIAPADDKKPN